MKIQHFLRNNERGSVLMEFILVAPLYLLLLGGTFTISEILLLNNRIATADRNISYLAYFLTEGRLEKHLKESLHGGDSVAYENDSGTKPVFRYDLRSIEKQGYTTLTNWGLVHAGYVSVRNIRMPSWVTGMMNTVVLLSGDAVKDPYFDLGELSSGETGHHFLIQRKSMKQTSRVSSESLAEYTYSTSRPYYEKAPYFLADMSAATSDEYLLTEQSGSRSSGSGGTQKQQSAFYNRVFGTLMTELERTGK